MAPLGTNRWQFSLRALLLATTIVAIAVALAVRQSWWAIAIGCVLAAAATLHFADRFVAVASRKWWVRVTTLLWIVSGAAMCVRGVWSLTYMADSPETGVVALPLALLLIVGGLCCFIAARYRPRR